MSLEVMFLIWDPSRPVLVQLTGTRTVQAKNAIGTKILSLPTQTENMRSEQPYNAFLKWH